MKCIGSPSRIRRFFRRNSDAEILVSASNQNLEGLVRARAPTHMRTVQHGCAPGCNSLHNVLQLVTAAPL
eukprot:4760568-Pyramimonas_sp.AAC.1